MSGWRRWWVVVGVFSLAWSGGARAQLGTGTADPLVELPPLLVEGSRRLPPWLYAKVDGVEYLSRCTTTTTRGSKSRIALRVTARCISRPVSDGRAA